MTQRWKLTIEYDGRPFHGWQRQDDSLSVQQVIEEAITKFSGETALLYVAGRTDAGVHARAQIAHFDLARDTDEDEILGALNYHVKPHPIAILAAEQVSEEFHARFQAQERSYHYLIINRRAPLALENGRAWHVATPLDVQTMQKAADILIGQHDFSTFRASHCQSKSPIKTLDEATIERQGELITCCFRARSFMYHQVRNMVGTLQLVGSGRWSLDDFSKAFDAKDRCKGGPTAPADGLYFWNVRY
ncbi:MAG: tRNA pseudouridine(38-40) synthase TruA [Bdellovibrionales bacterium]